MNPIKHLNWRKCIEASHIEAKRAGNDFYIYEVSFRQPVGYPFKINEYGCCICLEGEASGCIDLMPCNLKPSQMAINAPGQLLEQHTMSSDFKGVGITMSQGFIKGLGLSYNFQLDRMLREAPIIELQPSQLEAILVYCRMVNRLLEEERPYQMESLHHLTCAFLYSIGAYLYKLSADRHCSNEELLMQKFLAEVRTNYHKERKVLSYANRMNISPGHLFTVVKRVSGKSPGDWIDEYVIEEARALLKGTSLTVQQISHELGFPSQSFFGKFFKRVTGVSPKEYREN
ncbi:MAG: helix-turn-helix domain-containing protein [Bacteroidaceae bacterium]